jgi:hypothetical protein
MKINFISENDLVVVAVFWLAVMTVTMTVTALI